MPETSNGRSVSPATIDMEAWVCPAPLRDSPNIVMGHGGGGAMSGELIEHLFLPAFGPAADAGMGDSAIIEVGGARLAFSTDSFVVKPLAFPGGTIGDLAVNGTVNDLAMAGARPAVLSTAFILEEGTPLDELARVAQAVGTAAMAAGVKLVTGDTKVVDSGHGDGVYINTAGIGLVDERADIRPQRATPGDVVIISGDIGVHGVAVMSCREGLEFATTVSSDTAPLHGLVAAMLDTGADIHVLRDPTRGGLAASLNEIATTAGVGIEIVERQVPVPPEDADACATPGRYPFHAAIEGRLVAVVPAVDADRMLAVMRGPPPGGGAAVIGRVTAEPPAMVVAGPGLGATRVVDLPVGEQLPRIC